MIVPRPILLAYAPRAARGRLAALFDLDATLGRIVASTTEPMIGQMRLTWWYERLSALEDETAMAEPVLDALRPVVADGWVTALSLAAMVDGWEALLEPMPLDDAALRTFAVQRGDAFFAIAAGMTGGTAAAGLGAGWALADFAMRCSDNDTMVRAIKMARSYFAATQIYGPKPLRILAHVARAKAMQPPELIGVPISRRIILNAVLR